MSAPNPTSRRVVLGALAGMGALLGSRVRVARADDDTSVMLRPLGNGEDDWPTLMQVAQKVAYKSPIVMLPGTSGEAWLCKSVQLLPSGTTLIATADTVVQMSLTPSNAQVSSAFYAAPVWAGNSGSLSTGTNGSNIVAVSLPKTPSAGQAIQITHGLSGAVYDIVKVCGTGTYTLTLDRPVRFPFVSGDTVVVLSSYPKDIHILGRGMTITGTGDRAVQLIAACRCTLTEVNYDTSGGSVSDSAMSFDIGGRECAFIRCSVDMSGAPSVAHGLLLEASDGSHIRDCHAANCAAVGLYMVDSADSAIMNSTATSCGAGIGIGSDDGFGNFNCSVLACDVDTCDVGIASNTGAATKIFDCTATKCTNAGISISGTNDTAVSNCSSTNNGYGFIVGSGASNSLLRNIDGSSNSRGAVLATSNVDIDGLIAKAISTTQNVVELDGAQSRIHNFDIAATSTVNAINCGAGVTRISKGKINISGTSCIAVYVNGAVAQTENLTAVGSTAWGAVVVASGTFRRGPSVDFTGCQGDVYVEAGSYTNTGTVVANGNDPIDVQWPQLDANDYVALERIQDGGTPGITQVVTTAGVKFTVTSTEGDFSTYRYRIMRMA